MNGPLRRGARILLTSIVGFSLVVGLGSSALADDYNVGGSVGSTGNTGTTPGNSNTGGGASSGGSGSGTPAYTYINMQSIPVGLNPGEGMQGGCASQNGSNGLYIGYKWTYRAPYGTTRTQIENWLRAGSAEMSLVSRTSEKCLYTASWSDSRILCVLSLHADIAMTVPNAETLVRKNYNTAFGNSQTLANCLTGPTALSVDANVSAFGRYKFLGEYTQIACVHRHYLTGDGITSVKPADALLNCGSSYTQSVPAQNWQLDCKDGFTNYWHGSPSWTADDCKGVKNSVGSVWTCTAPGTNLLNGLPTNSATLFRSNDLNPVSYGVSEISGTGVTVTGSESSVLRTAGGTPWNSFGNRASSDNNFSINRDNRNVLRTDTSTHTVAGTTGEGWSLAANWASDAGSSTETTGKYHYEILMDTLNVSINSIDINTGTASVTQTVTQIATTADCFSTPLRTTFVRAITTS